MSKKDKKRSCAHCGVEFFAWAMSVKTCSYKCRAALKLSERVRDGMVRCAKCREWKPEDQFVKASRRASTGAMYGVPHSYCKPCNADHIVPAETRKRPYREAYTLAPEVLAANTRERNHRNYHKRRAGGPLPSRALLDELLRSQDARCAYCGVELVPGMHLDHRLPVARGGGNELENLCYACPTCNTRKNAMTDEEFLVSKKRPVRKAA